MSLQEVRTVEILSEEIALIKPKSKVCYFVLNLIKNALTKKRSVRFHTVHLDCSIQLSLILFI